MQSVAAAGVQRARVSKDQWLAQALEELVRGGIAAVRVERLARALAVAKSGFYWHFDGLDDLHRHLLDYWSSEYTGAIMARVEEVPREPRAQLELVMELVEEGDFGRYDFAMHGWAKQDAAVRAAVDEVVASRLAFIGRIFARLGFSGDELDMRTRLFVCNEMWQKETYPSISERHRARLRKLRLDLLIGS
jgi:AcrR family transcriptional regulator